MHKKRKYFYFIPLFILVAIAVLSVVVMLLWNGVVTAITNAKPVTYPQAIGLFILSKILFTSFRPGPPGGFRRGGPPWRSKLMNLSAEEQEKLKQEWQQRSSERQSQE